MNFSVLISIYYKEKPEYFNRAMQSIWDEQTVRPNEIVLVEDGHLTNELYKEINIWKNKLEDSLKIVSLNKNVGLGDALNIGLQHCSNEIVARMDTDDISLPNRFKKQLKVFENKDIDVCSAWISEFDADEEKIISYRKIPEKHDDIVKYGKSRSPVNHIPAMFKKSAVKKAGGYKKMMWMEDYYLWIRMMMSGAKFYNIQEVLANIRSNEDQMKRRRGLDYLKSEIKLFKEFKNIGYLNNYEYIKNIFLRIIVRLMPASVIRIIYKIIRIKL